MADTKKMKIREIVKVLGHKDGTSQASGKDYTVFEYMVDATVDGKDVDDVQFSMLESGTKHNADIQKRADEAIGKVNAEFDVMVKQYKGNDQYSAYLPKPEGQGGGKKGGYGGGYNREPATKYTRDELKALAEWGIKTGEEVLGINRNKCDAATLGVLQAFSATMVIAAQKCDCK